MGYESNQIDSMFIKDSYFCWTIVIEVVMNLVEYKNTLYECMSL